MNPLPVEKVLEQLRAALAAAPNAVLIAPPGAGKTTTVAPALLGEPWVQGGKLLLLQPRRLAARAAAERMADLLGERVGQTFGYRTRMDTRVSAATRVEVITDGVFTNLIQADPELAGVAAVLFDEAHERSLEGDLGLALALDAQSGFRPDLRLIAMSATLDGARFAGLMHGAPVIASEGRMFPVDIRHLGRDRTARIEDRMAAAIHRALDEEPGSVLAFLPGVAEIERTAERLRLPEGVALHRLHGALDPAAQRAAIAPAPPGTRKLVLATSIAETSITIDGVRVVIDSGLARRARYDRAAGITRLSTERVSQAAATQRAGRAGRTAPGVALRLWDAGETAGFAPFDPPEILEADLSDLTLALAEWGADAAALRWLDPPPAAALAEARARLAVLGALGPDGRPTAHGRRIAALPLPPRLAHMLALGADAGTADPGAALLAAQIAILIGERGLGGRSVDLEDRLAAWARDRSPRADAARTAAARLARTATPSPSLPSVAFPSPRRGEGDARHNGHPPPNRGREMRSEAERGRESAFAASSAPATPDLPARLLAHAYPDRIARARGQAGAFLMANGRGARLDPGDALARADWLVVADAGGAAEGARISLAARLDAASLEAVAGTAIERTATVRFDPATGSVVAESRVRLGAITVARTPLADPDPVAVTRALIEGVRTGGLALLPWSDAATSLRARAAFARAHGHPAPDLSDSALLASLENWLEPALGRVRRLDAVPPEALIAALDAMFDYAQRRAFEAFAPPRFTSPAGASHFIDYAVPGGPTVEVRVQELFGLTNHPMVGPVPLILTLLSPARKPIQKTTDLVHLWSGSWSEIRRELRGRYPRHPWPQDPRAAPPTTRAKPRGT